ncbi:MAG: radical SAM protein [Deltaproteobacteria bacterium]|nr:radical SAM protein [Deltaproteobacteria bacterium]
MTEAPKGEVFHLVLIKPSHYDDEGYPIRWLRSAIPSNTLAVLNGLGLDCAERRSLGRDVEIVVSVYDETNTRIRPQRIAKQIRDNGGRGLVGMVGVQSNQFPRAVDLARVFRAEGLQVCIGGFHVSGCLAMLPELPEDLREAMDLGISLFAGEAEGRLEELLQDAYRGELKPLYNFLKDLPDLRGAPGPRLPASQVQRTAGSTTSFDAGRGCPFECSFCTIINVQGHESRRRSADDVEKLIRHNLAQGVRNFFITDDNFARNAEWEKILDRVISLREEGLKIKLTIQVDTMSHKIPRFIEKCGRAGVARAFIGMESIDPKALAHTKKRQNRITEYRSMLQQWGEAGVMTLAGYILGFPSDTPESIARDIEIIKRELPIDLMEFFVLTPLPGSEDHQRLHKEGVWMDPDMNKYDTMHVTTAHAQMSPEAWMGAVDQAWKAYYTPEHIATVMRRARGRGVSRRRTSLLWFYSCVAFEKIHPLDGGFLRLRSRRERRPSLPLESRLIFYSRHAWRTFYNQARLLALVLKFRGVRKDIKRDPNYREYTDLALTPVEDPELAELELFTQSASAQAAAAKAQTRSAAASAR